MYDIGHPESPVGFTVSTVSLPSGSVFTRGIHTNKVVSVELRLIYRGNIHEKSALSLALFGRKLHTLRIVVNANVTTVIAIISVRVCPMPSSAQLIICSQDILLYYNNLTVVLHIISQGTSCYLLLIAAQSLVGVSFFFPISRMLSMPL